MSTPLSEISGTLSTHQQVSSDFDEIRAMTRSKDGTTPSWLAPARAVQAALETIDEQIVALKSALKSYQTEDAQKKAVLEGIANFGFNGFTGGHKVPTMAALMDLNLSGGSESAKAKAKLTAQAFKKYLDSSELIEYLDDPPVEFKVTMSIRATLGGALSTLIAAL